MRKSDSPKPVQKSAKHTLAEKPLRFGIPSQEQLAIIAATLARSNDDAPHKLAQAALGIWEACAKEIVAHSSRISARQLEMKEFLNLYEKFLAPQSFSLDGDIPRDVFFRWILPQSRAGDLARIVKAYLRDVLRQSNGKEPAVDEIDQAYGTWKLPLAERKLSEEKVIFLNWYGSYIKKSRRAAGKKSAAKKADEQNGQSLRSK